MNCQEVMELMQRQLDGDLDAQEEEELHVHLMHCLECAQMFERLQLLSDELSQLPKVVPPFSLVDSILPQLNEIHMAAEASIADSTPTAPSRVVSERAGSSKNPSRIGSYFSWKLAGGVVAAGLVIGFFAFQNSGSVNQQADELLQPRAAKYDALASAQSKSSDASDKAASQNDSGGPAAAAATDSSASSEQDHEPQNSGQPAGGVQQASPEASPEGAWTVIDQTAKPNADAKPRIEANTGSEAGASSKTSPESSKKPEQAQPKVQGIAEAGQQDQPGQSSQPEAAPSAAPSTLRSSDEDQALTPAATPGANTLAPALVGEPSPHPQTNPEDTPDETVQPPKAKAGPSMGISSFTLSAPVPFTSESGLYEAIVENDQVVVRDATTHKAVFTSSHKWQSSDQITLVEWSQDNKLTYRVVSGENEQTFVIDAAAKEELTP
ncbi:zf-HC2 domain-containing protein [Paenibacillus hexagrammi]|uniref:Zf-HC2 domain-containing protein n=1 Tax=Paenibacillus hexagrammi TaxID=2908839 RepID=A0ABY3SNI2_9BACL|nr:zf-HC2 domain-containing protein [Paenibacillus sp. YPD9-1]UJF35038.1 zf-HC2 domain-containing protein [Paenibacillus sp. YPD9-1]